MRYDVFIYQNKRKNTVEQMKFLQPTIYTLYSSFYSMKWLHTYRIKTFCSRKRFNFNYRISLYYIEEMTQQYSYMMKLTEMIFSTNYTSLRNWQTGSNNLNSYTE